MQFLNNNSLLLSNKVLDFLWEKQVVTSNNISNNETPGYKAKYLTFEDELRKRVNSARNKNGREIGRAIRETKYQINYTENETTRADGNNVSTDVESMELAKAGIEYEYVLKAFNDDITRLRTVIKG
ncbi:MAG: flagellar basal body rod protein FlgB [Firmicutes bacterium]|nr:flagellar basal body rod protein FlgB [Bacillota bacterium]